tara:strand:- start:790 stop:945 length:156 start_codon:yes stop_codon:yes gene_type:complete
VNFKYKSNIPSEITKAMATVLVVLAAVVRAVAQAWRIRLPARHLTTAPMRR